MDRACCSPSRGGLGEAAAVNAAAAAPQTEGMVLVPEGEFGMGSDDRWSYPEDGEGPPREVETRAYWIDACAVTNAVFAAFAEDTAYVSEAERFGWTFVFAGLLRDDFPPTQAVAQAPWWRKVEGADWKHPEGPDSSLDERLEHPVVHVSWNDAVAFPPGRASVFRPRRNGSARLAARSRGACFRGETRSSRRESTA